MAKRELPTWQSVPLYFVVTGLALCACALPRRVEVGLGRALGRLVFRLRLFKRRVVEENLARCLPDLEPRAKLALIRRNYEHYGILLFEFMHFFSPFKGHWRAYVPTAARAEGLEHWKAAHAKGKGVILFCSHLGSWETGAAAVALNGIEATPVTTVLTPRWLHDKITRSRSSVGMNSAFHPGSMVTVLKTLRRGGTVAFMNDQYARPPMGVPVTFFGTRVDTLSVIGPLAKRTGAPVLPLHTYRAEDGTTVAVIEPEFDLGADPGDPEGSTQRVAARVEDWVRANPEHWLWMHRRFKNLAPAA